MSVTLMAASCDSIGSCSLDVDAESLVGSLAGSSQVEPHRTAGDAELSEETLHSFLLSSSANSNGHALESPIQSENKETAKKPSYLNLACSISGYGGITTYDSKLREGFRSRDHSPGRLAGSREASPARGLSGCRSNCGNFLTAPNTSRLSWTPSPVEMKHASLSTGVTQRNSTTNGTDQPDGTVKRLSEQRNKWLESTLSPSEKSKEYQNVVSVFEARADANHGLKTETTFETRYELNTSSHSTVVSSTTVITSSDSSFYPSNQRNERIIPMTVEKCVQSKNNFSNCSDDTLQKSLSNGSSTHHSSTSTKSFIQQRVERLYGPCALAQGFFHRSYKNPATSPLPCFETNGVAYQTAQDERGHNQVPGRTSPSSPVLPVLRHLRPEFRDQLAVAPRRSVGSRIPGELSPPKSSVLVQQTQSICGTGPLQHQTSTESLADLQPAAPEVVLPQQISSLPCEIKNDLVSTALVKEALEEQRTLEAKSSNTEDNIEFTTVILPDNEESPGHMFLRLQRLTIEKVLKLAERAEYEIENSGVNGNAVLSEEALGHLRAAAGQARLLVTQKMVQFEGLCHKCISQSPDELFPTTVEDLQGFWDMLQLQVEQVNSTFARLDKLRAAGWCEDMSPRTTNTASKKTPRTGTGKASGAAAAGGSAKAAEAAALRRQREDERRKMMEQRRKELRQKQPNPAASDEMIEIFTAQPS